MHHAYTIVFFFFFFKQKTAYEMRISDWSSDVCSSDLHFGHFGEQAYQNGIPSALGLEARISLREAGQHALHLSLKLRGSILLHHGLQLPMRAKHAAIKPQSLWPHRVADRKSVR